MRQVTIFFTLTAALALVGCASQAPATSSGTGASVGSVAATSTGTSAHQASAAAIASATSSKDKFEIPSGYQQVMVNGRKVFCHSVAPPDSRIKQKECFSQEELQQMQTASQQYLESLQRMNAAYTSSGIASGNAGAANGGGR